MAQSFYVMTMPGLETLAFSEIRAHIPDADLIKFTRGIAIFQARVSPRELLKLRTTEDVFATVAHITGLGHAEGVLRVLHSAVSRADIASTIAQWRAAHKERPPRSWRVISQMQGTYDFRRVDAGKAVSDALRKQLPRSMHLVDDDADLEFWLSLGGSEAFVGLRLSDATMRHRTYKREHIPASLRPTVAAAMGWLSQPTPDDIVLDPLCGAGTLIIERARLAPLQKAIGGDRREEVVGIARRNAQAASVAAEWHTWDARSLPLNDASVTRVITNLPFGKQIGSRQENETLYAALAREFGRVLSPNGIMVALTSEDRLWERVVRQQDWRITKKSIVVVLGQPASIFVTERRPVS